MYAVQENMFDQIKQASPKSINIISLRMVKETSLPYQDSICNARSVVKLITPMFKDLAHEQCVIVGLNTDNRPTTISIIGTGTVNQSPVFISSALKALLLSNSVSGILVHNHPSDTMNPSSADIAIVKRLKEACSLVEIALQDSIIVNSDCSEHTSMRQLSSWPI